MRQHWIKVDGSIEVRDGDDPTLQEMQEFVGGNIEHVRVLFMPEGSEAYIRASMIVNEEGLIYGLPFNQKATEIYHNAIRRQKTTNGMTYHIQDHSPIVGNAIVFEGEWA